MKILDIFVKSYAKMHKSGALLPPLRYFTRSLASRWIPFYLSHSGYKKAKQDIPVIVSLTSFPERINYVWQVVECMLRQSYRPQKIILWLSKEEFPDKATIPHSLSERVGDRFEIRLVDKNIRSHKKYHYVSQANPDGYVFLVDDDLYYATDLLERTWKEHEKHPDAVIVNYGYEIAYGEDGSLLPYRKWGKCFKYSTSPNLFFGSGGGTLFKPSALYKDLTDIKLALELTPIADDIWLNAMVRMAKLKMVMLSNGLILPYKIKNKNLLATQNINEGLNDKQLNNVIQYYLRTIGVNPFAESVKRR